MRGFRIAGWVVFGIIAAGIFGLVFGYLVKVLWNWLMPAIFGLPDITYWQAFGIVILAKLIFGAIGRGKGHWNKHDDHHFEHWDEYEDTEGKKSGFEKFKRYRFYHDFWEKEGKSAFEDYIRRKEEGSKSAEGEDETTPE
jgi:hypothetical protein